MHSCTPLTLGCIHSRTCTCISLSRSVPWMVCPSKDGVERDENSSTYLCVHTRTRRCSSSKRTKNLSTAGTMRLVTRHSTSPADMDTLWATDILLFLPTCPLCTDTRPHSLDSSPASVHILWQNAGKKPVACWNTSIINDVTEQDAPILLMRRRRSYTTLRRESDLQLSQQPLRVEVLRTCLIKAMENVAISFSLPEKQGALALKDALPHFEVSVQ